MKFFKFLSLFFIFIKIFSHSEENIEKKFYDYKKEFDGFYQVIEFDQTNDLVIFKKYYKNFFITIDSIKPKDKYLLEKKDNYLKILLSNTYVEYMRSTSQKSGLITDIDIPISFGKMSSFFGEGGKIVVEGSERIDYSGSKTFDLTAIEKGTANISWIPELMLKQQLIVNVTGSVGDRIKVNLKHNSETDRKSDNNVLLEYKGLDDDILQLVQMGDVSISLPGIKLIGGTPQHKGLFGIKGSGQFGDLNYIFVASKQSGENEQRQFVGNTRIDSLVVYDIDYLKNKFFLLDISPEDSLVVLNVYKDDGIGTNNDEEGVLPAKLYFSPQIHDSLFFEGYFSLMIPGDGKDYVYYRKGHFIEFTNALNSYEVLGISYIVKRSNGKIDTVGTVNVSGLDTLVLKIIKQKDDYPYSPTWQYMMKNIYSFNAKNVIPESFELSIKKVNTGSGEDIQLQGDSTFLWLLGLDQNNDGKIDLNFIDFQKGYIIFPSLYPFASEKLTDNDSIIYWTLESGTNVGRKYYLKIKYRGSQSIYSLGTYNIIEGSEVVKVNGIVLTKDKDYTIDYEYGIINFLTDMVNSPTANITVDYQYSPFLSLSSKNLLGLHLDYTLTDKIFANSNWIYNTLSYNLEDYPRIGEEPQEILLGEADFSYNDQFYHLSDMVNLLPFYNTTLPSNLTINSKLALSNPQNNSAGKASIENMESVIVSNDISIDRKSWVYGSLPFAFTPENLSYNYYWYNSIETKGNINDLIPQIEKTNDVSILNIFMKYEESSALNTFVTLNQLISRTGIDMSDMMFLEIWVKGDEGELVIEVGKNMPEDMVRRKKDYSFAGPDGILQSEDKNNDGILDANEDTGLDGVAGDDAHNITGDDGNDDYSYSLENPNDYTKINGTENNNMLDSEDLDRDGSLNSKNDYYKFKIDLSSNENLVYRNSSTGWKLYRIPLNSNYVEIVGNPDLKFIKYSRLYWYGISKNATLSLYQISMVTNKWKTKMINGDSTKFFYGVKNNQTDPDYIPPFNPGIDFSGKPKREQSMILYCNDFNYDESGKVYKILPQRDTYERYQKIEFYLRSTDSDSFYFYLKFGGDSLNYYYIKYNPKSKWDTIVVSLDSLINLKRSKDGQIQGENGIYGFYGSPSLTNIGYLEMFAKSFSNKNISTQIWVDDIMLVEPKNEIGYAGDLSSTLQIPEILNLSIITGFKNPYFKMINDKYGNGNFTTNYTISTSLNGEKLLPEFLGIASPLSFSFSKSTNKPVYYVGSDYLLTSSEIERFSTYSTNSNFSASLKRISNFNNRLLHYTLDIPSFTYSYNNASNISYSRIDSTKTNSSSINFNYDFSIIPLKFFKKIDFYYFPSNISYSLSYNKNLTRSFLLGESGFVDVGQNFFENINGSLSLRYRIFNSLDFNYQENKIYDFSKKVDNLFGFLGEKIGENNTSSITYSPVFIKYITHNLNATTSFYEKNNKNFYSVDTFFSNDLSQNFRMSLNGTFNYAKILSLITSLRDESKDSTYITGSPGWIVLYIEKFLNNFSAMNYSFSFNRTTNYNYVKNNPPLYYKLGIVDTLPSNYLTSFSQNRNSLNYNYSFGTGMVLSKIDLNGSFSSSFNRSDQNGNIVKDFNVKWPTLNLSILNVEEYFNIYKILRFLNISSSISKSENLSFINDTTLNRKNTSYDFYPLLGLSGSTNFNLNINYNLNYSKSLSISYSTIQLSRVNKTYSNTVSITYPFSSPTGFSLPFIKSVIKFRSTVNTGIDFSITNVQDQDLTNSNMVEDKIVYDFKPRADYNFTNDVSGGLTINFSRSEDKKRGDKRQMISVGFWTLFRF